MTRPELAEAERRAEAKARRVRVPDPVPVEDLRLSSAVEEGALYQAGRSGVYYAAPLTYWRLTHEGREPMLSRWSLGMREVRRDRRRR